MNYNNEKYEMLNDKSAKTGTKDFLLGAVVGGVIGAAMALWLSPKSGTALREQVSEQVSNQTAALKEKAGSLQTKVSDLAQITKEKTNSLTQTITQQSTDALSKLRGKNQTDTEEHLDTDIDSIQLMLAETKKAFDETEEKLNH